MSEREEKATELLSRLMDAVYTVQCESNGIWDNGWRKAGELEFDWELECPVASFTAAMERLGPIADEARDFLDPVEAAKRKRWADACATASAIMDIFKQGGWNPSSGLHRNIADAINGSFVVTAEDRKAGKPTPPTMADKLNALVSQGELVDLKPNPRA